MKISTYCQDARRRKTGSHVAIIKNAVQVGAITANASRPRVMEAWKTVIC